MSPLVITLDGPAAAGKSTVARMLSEELGIPYLDTGAMYRVAAWKATRDGVRGAKATARLIRETRMEIGGSRVACDGEDVTDRIRTEAVTRAVKPIAGAPECREAMREMQRAHGRHGVVAEGRDQGSVVFPDADHKFYLDADLEVRAARRHREQGGELEKVRAAIAGRDADDRSRPVGTLVVPEGAVTVDTSALTLQEVVAKILAAVGPRPGRSGGVGFP